PPTARAIRSASPTAAPRSASIAATVDLPVAMPPVSPMIRTRGSSLAAQAHGQPSPPARWPPPLPAPQSPSRRSAGDRLLDGPGIRLAHQVDPTQGPGEVQACRPGEAEMLSRGVPGLQVALGHRAPEWRPRDATEGGRFPGRQDLVLVLSHRRFLPFPSALALTRRLDLVGRLPVYRDFGALVSFPSVLAPAPSFGRARRPGRMRSSGGATRLLGSGRSARVLAQRRAPLHGEWEEVWMSARVRDLVNRLVECVGT